MDQSFHALTVRGSDGQHRGTMLPNPQGTLSKEIASK